MKIIQIANRISGVTNTNGKPSPSEVKSKNARTIRFQCIGRDNEGCTKANHESGITDFMITYANPTVSTQVKCPICRVQVKKLNERLTPSQVIELSARNKRGISELSGKMKNIMDKKDQDYSEVDKPEKDLPLKGYSYTCLACSKSADKDVKVTDVTIFRSTTPPSPKCPICGDILKGKEKQGIKSPTELGRRSKNRMKGIVDIPELDR